MATTSLFTIGYDRILAASAESDFFSTLREFLQANESARPLLQSAEKQHSNENFDETLQRRSARNEADKFKRARKRSDQLRQIVFILKLRKISCNHEVGRSLAKPTVSGKKKCSDNATSKFDAFKRPVQWAV
ncbi:hypothetical protein AVEN_245084-1 [Araneus ventricosus]|uniref:Uncharacterized protein n=1 Tax=Araneus ventricosus TaxID=182803 RepID=A0A4Y2EA07_ARAVE|nr:hypothetical protein AVEN_245084-1 [Araneus ventricosus]